EFKFTLPLADHGYQAGIMWARAYFAEPNFLAPDEELYAKYTQPAQILSDGLCNMLRLAQGFRVHCLGLPAFYVISRDLSVSDRLAKMGLGIAVGVKGSHGKQCNFVIKINKAFDNYS